MTDYSIAVADVPVGGRAVANIRTKDAGEVVDIDSITTEWRDHLGNLVETLTRTTVDVTGSDIYGNPSTITDTAGTGTYQATLVIEDLSPPTIGHDWTLTVILERNGFTADPQVFTFTVIPVDLESELDSGTRVTPADVVERLSTLPGLKLPSSFTDPRIQNIIDGCEGIVLSRAGYTSYPTDSIAIEVVDDFIIRLSILTILDVVYATQPELRDQNRVERNALLKEISETALTGASIGLTFALVGGAEDSEG